MDKEFLKGHLPVLVLGLLDGKPMHGYALCEALRDCGRGGNLELGEGTIYPLLHRLEKQGHIKATWQRGETGKQRKVYRLTRTGQKQIAAHRADFHQLDVMFRNIFGTGWSET